MIYENNRSDQDYFKLSPKKDSNIKLNKPTEFLNIKLGFNTVLTVETPSYTTTILPNKSKDFSYSDNAHEQE